MFKKLEELEVYQLSEKLADEVWNTCIRWENFAKFTVGKQLVTAADSISANISEGHGRFSMKENLQFCYYARGSFDETRNWLRRAYSRELLTKKQIDSIKEIMDELGPKLNALITSIKRQSKR
ncbi:MAG: four helix bundle protein [Bacteroidetes bacterium]|nr:MAG: four helix bundle protein [Bacteroidota bacterium]